MNITFVMCINNKGYPLDLTLHKVYKVIPDPSAEDIQMVRVVDDSGEDYLHDASRFAPVELSSQAERSFEIEMA